MKPLAFLLLFKAPFVNKIILDFLGFLLYDKSVNEGKRAIAMFI